jgi:nucleoside-diphosphate-sugar epimerase
VAVVGATGPTGRALVQELKKRDITARAVSRSLEKLNRFFPGNEIEKIQADAMHAAALREAVKDCPLIVDCIGLPPERIADHPVTAGNVAAAAREEGARCLHVSSFWGFLPLRSTPVDETHPRRGGNRYVRARRAAEDVMLEHGAAVIHLPDFFGPAVHSSLMQQLLEDASAGKTLNCIGSAQTEREYAYVPDAMRIVADLLERDEAYGKSWIIPGAGPISGEKIAGIAGRHLKRPVKARGFPAALLKIVSLLSSDLRAFRPMIDDYAKPISYKTERTRKLLGEIVVTPYEESIPATLEWLGHRTETNPPGKAD